MFATLLFYDRTWHSDISHVGAISSLCLDISICTKTVKHYFCCPVLHFPIYYYYLLQPHQTVVREWNCVRILILCEKTVQELCDLSPLKHWIAVGMSFLTLPKCSKYECVYLGLAILWLLFRWYFQAWVILVIVYSWTHGNSVHMTRLNPQNKNCLWIKWLLYETSVCLIFRLHSPRFMPPVRDVAQCHLWTCTIYFFSLLAKVTWQYSSRKDRSVLVHSLRGLSIMVA